jgi:mRNA-degrading endonuclease toxin of MazEF toxin-antitoxin module
MGRSRGLPRRRRVVSSLPARGVNLDAVESVSVVVLVERLGRLGHDRMLEVCAAREVAVDFGR